MCWQSGCTNTIVHAAQSLCNSLSIFRTFLHWGSNRCRQIMFSLSQLDIRVIMMVSSTNEAEKFTSVISKFLTSSKLWDSDFVTNVRGDYATISTNNHRFVQSDYVPLFASTLVYAIRILPFSSITWNLIHTADSATWSVDILRHARRMLLSSSIIFYM